MKNWKRKPPTSVRKIVLKMHAALVHISSVHWLTLWQNFHFLFLSFLFNNRHVIGWILEDCATHSCVCHYIQFLCCYFFCFKCFDLLTRGSALFCSPPRGSDTVRQRRMRECKRVCSCSRKTESTARFWDEMNCVPRMLHIGTWSVT